MLLDTHVWLWITVGDVNRLGPKTRRAIIRVASRGELAISVVSLFEIAGLSVIGRIAVRHPVERWLRDAIGLTGVRVVDVSPTVAIDAGSVPASTLGDPMDRLLAATAGHLDLPLVTRDASILAYARRSGRLRAIDAAE